MQKAHPICLFYFTKPPQKKKKVLLILGVNANNRPSYVFFYLVNERTMSFSL